MNNYSFNHIFVSTNMILHQITINTELIFFGLEKKGNRFFAYDRTTYK